MKVIIKSTNFKLTPSLAAFIEEKILSLAKFLKTVDEFEAVTARVEVGKTTRHHKKGEVFRAEVNLDLPKAVLRSEAIQNDLRAAVNEVRKELKREIEKYKDKLKPYAQ